ncbi:PEGA domain-containing protein [Petrotoga sp. Shatin.DS.tank11.9.2.9.3]|uniref:PEGA domain-containing protein n=1 Tax=Petrotoga sp. Shatin.DS.tank11.9.2.9.3 TaxID=1469556 RepID=UPI000EF2543A|nr:PEGA domain-containing protein [Petrotoga sp. Shatin.DS.tank11.9.2.9.3]RLL83229.1 hypothetical protein BZ25_07090 [Petrotoga sp. Shatin.DS.tank11.9.2.9.3]
MYRRFLVFLVLIFTTFLFSYTINLIALPGSEVYFDSQFMGTVTETPFTIEVPNDTDGYLHVKKLGYSDFIVRIELLGSESQITAEQVPLAKLIFDINVDSANIKYTFLNQDYNIALPTSNEVDIPYNVEKIIIEKDGFFAKELNLELKPFDKKNLRVSLIPSNEILIESNPNQANVFVDGKLIGTTPITVKRDNFDIILLEKEGYLVKTIKNLPQDDRILIDLEKGIELFVDSEPKDVGVFLDGEYVGSTPMKGLFPTGTYNLTLSKLGYESKEMLIELTQNGLNRYYVELNPFLNTINFLNSENYEFNIDGKYVGKGIDSIILDDSPHFVRIVSGTKSLEFPIYRDFYDKMESIDLNKLSTVNVYAMSNTNVSFLGKTQKTPAFFLYNMLNNAQFVNLRTLNRTYSVLLEPSESVDIYTGSDFGNIFITTNVKDPLIYIDGQYLNLNDRFGYPLKSGVYTVEVRKFNEIKQRKVTINPGEKSFVHFEFDSPVPVKVNFTGEKYTINGEEYTNSQKTFFLPSGPTLFSNGVVSVVLFVNEPMYVDLDKLFGGL